MRNQHGDAFARTGLAAARGKDEKPPTFVVTRWTPFEASVVPIPADVNAGFGKSAGVDPEPEPQQKTQPRKSSFWSNAKWNKSRRRPSSKSCAATPSPPWPSNTPSTSARTTPPISSAMAARSKPSRILIEKIQTKHTDTSAISLGLTPKEIKRYSLGRALAAAITGDWRDAGFERECSESVAKLMGRSPEGFFLPPEAFKRDFNVGTASEAGNLVATDLRADLFVDVLRNNLVMGQLGARVLTGLSGNIDLPRKSTASTIGTVTEIGCAPKPRRPPPR